MLPFHMHVGNAAFTAERRVVVRAPHYRALPLIVLLTGGCEARSPEMPFNPTSPTPASRGAPTSDVPQRVALGEVVEIELNAAVSSGWYCEIGNDPVPCTLFVVDVPRAGTVVIRMDFDSAEPMFIEMGNLAIAHLAFKTGGSPLVASATVPAGALPFRVGLNLPWGRNGLVMRFRVIATLE